MKKWSIAFCVLYLCALLAGCAPTTMQNVNDLLRAPDLGQGQGEMQKALAKHLSKEPQYKYPKEGEQRNPLVVADLDGDGVNEGVIAYSSPSTSILSEQTDSVSLAFLKKVKNEWSVVKTVQGKDVEVASLQVVDILGDGTKQILIGYTNQKRSSKVLELMKYTNGEVALALTMAYSSYVLGDFTGKGGTDLVVVTPIEQLTGMQLQFISSVDGNFGELQAPVPLDIAFEACDGIYPGKDTSGNPVIVVDGIKSDGNVKMLISQLIYYSGELFYADSGTLRGKSARISALLKSADIDDDGIVEIPKRIGQDAINTPMADKNLEYIEWLDFTSAELSGDLEPQSKQFGVLDSDRAMYVKLPESWRGQIEVTDGSAAGEWQVKRVDTYEVLLSMSTKKEGEQKPEKAIEVAGYANTFIVFGKNTSLFEQNEVEIKPLA